MKVPHTLGCFAFLSLSSLLNGQSLISSGAFFDPVVRAQHEMDAPPTLTVDLTIDPDPVTDSGSAGSNPGVSWTHGAGGYVGVELLGLAEAHLAPFTETTGDSLVFGRQISAGVLGIGGDLGTVLSPVLSANSPTTWSSSAVLSGINIVANQLYQVSFTVAPGSNLSVGLLDNASFGIGTPGIEDAGGSAVSNLNLLGLLVVGSTLEGVATFTFQSDVDRTDIQFDFNADSTLGVGALGGTAGDTTVLTFSEFAVTAVPEPSVTVLGVSLAGLLLIRRRRVG